ncbi:DNA/RNA helicase domain-containing protein [Methanobrevibacter thaueri]|uniref:DNA/RNA helicase domain-containing protein n=1 Tax=Methanobrevibacter thaueri TaxID=190975 RepID=UPI003869297E
MIVYEATKAEFCQSVFDQTIVDEIYAMFQEKLGRKTSEAEIRSWENSMEFMDKILDDSEIPDDSSVAIEFTIPLTSKRIDFMIAGEDGNKDDSVIIIELKQWDKAEKVEGKDAIVKTFLGGGIRETTHPSYQAWSYTCLLKDFNQTVEEEDLPLYPCAYLHNYHFIDDDPLKDEMYERYYDEAPLYGKGDRQKLRDFIKKYIKYGDESDILCRIDHGKIKPSKKLQDSIYSMLHGNDEFIMIDDQKVVYETAIEMADKSKDDDKKRVLIVEGGPGTGKSVLAINLLAEIINLDMVALYVTKNSAPRNVFFEKLKGGDFSKTYIKNLFKSSGSFTQTEENQFDVLIVDEAHRLNEKSGFFGNLGENQVKEIINSSKFSIFFIDKHQKIAFNDYGSIDAIEKFANEANAEIVRTELISQFRCNGSDGYLSWLDDVLELEETANFDGFGIDYDFRVIDDACELRDLIFEKNQEIDEKTYKKYEARLLAGYCWNWDREGRENTDYHDIRIGDFEMSWNLGNTDTWAIDETSVNEVGCIHTSQGLEFDYVGVIIGEDMRYENGNIVTDFNARAKTDQSLKGIKTFYKTNPDGALKVADEIIKNTYRTLMTRGMKGCYVYCEDMALQTYFKERLENIKH